MLPFACSIEMLIQRSCWYGCFDLAKSIFFAQLQKGGSVTHSLNFNFLDDRTLQLDFYFNRQIKEERNQRLQDSHQLQMPVIQ